MESVGWAGSLCSMWWDLVHISLLSGERYVGRTFLRVHDQWKGQCTMTGVVMKGELKQRVTGVHQDLVQHTHQ